VPVLTDYDTLRDGVHHGGVSETDAGVPVPAESVRRLACDAEIIPFVMDGAGVVLDEGRAKRTATPEQRRALRAMHRHCVHPDCTVAFEHCDVRHITPWWDGGTSGLDNLAPVCSRHHHLAHEGRWMSSLRPDRTVEWQRPDGTTYVAGSSASVAPNGVSSELHDLLQAVIDNAIRLRRANGPPTRLPAP